MKTANRLSILLLRLGYLMPGGYIPGLILPFEYFSNPTIIKLLETYRIGDEERMILAWKQEIFTGQKLIHKL